MQGGQDGDQEETLVAASEGDSVIVPPSGPEMQMCEEVKEPALPQCSSGPDTQEEALQMQAGSLPAECSLAAFGRFFVERLPAHEQNAVF